MIARLRGTLLDRGSDAVVIDAGGIGFAVRASRQTLAAMPAVGLPVELRTRMYVGESGVDLYGFSEAAEERAFDLLNRVQGIGPRTALQILSAVSVSELARHVASGDKQSLRALQGIGPKTAERMIVELRDAFAALALATGAHPSAMAPALSEVKEQAVGILIGMGMKQAQAGDAVRRAPDGTLEEVVAAALRGSVPR